MNDRKAQIQYKMYIGRHLAELSELVGRPVESSELLGLDRTAELRYRSSAVPKPTEVFEMAFHELPSERFSQLLRAAHERRPQPVYLWTEHSVTCGVLQLASILEFNSSFSFDVDDNGIISFTPESMADRILLDLEERDGAQLVCVELAGAEWGRLKY